MALALAHGSLAGSAVEMDGVWGGLQQRAPTVVGPGKMKRSPGIPVAEYAYFHSFCRLCHVLFIFVCVFIAKRDHVIFSGPTAVLHLVLFFNVCVFLLVYFARTCVV